MWNFKGNFTYLKLLWPATILCRKAYSSFHAFSCRLSFINRLIYFSLILSLIFFVYSVLVSHFEKKIYDFNFEAWVGAFPCVVHEEKPFISFTPTEESNARILQSSRKQVTKLAETLNEHNVYKMNHIRVTSQHPQFVLCWVRLENFLIGSRRT